MDEPTGGGEQGCVVQPQTQMDGCERAIGNLVLRPSNVPPGPSILERIDESDDNSSTIALSKTPETNSLLEPSGVELPFSPEMEVRPSSRECLPRQSNPQSSQAAPRETKSCSVEIPFSTELQARPPSGDSRSGADSLSPIESTPAGPAASKPAAGALPEVRSPLSFPHRLKSLASLASNPGAKPRISRQKLVEKAFEFAIVRTTIEREVKDRFGERERERDRG